MIHRAAVLCQVGLLLAVAAGCAIDDRGFVRRTCWENERSWVVRLEAWGVHLVTNDVDGGLTVGRSDRTYFFARPADGQAADGAAADVMDLIVASALAPVPPEAVPPLKDLGTPVAFASRDGGIMVHANDSRTGVTIGLASRAAVRLPADFDGVLVMRFDANDPAHNRFILEEVKP